jgi:hypothetical protein
MWVGNSKFLPVVGPKGTSVGVVTVREVMSNRLFACLHNDDVHPNNERGGRTPVARDRSKRDAGPRGFH